MTDVLGLPLDQARAAANGASPEIRRIEPPRGARDKGTERVVRVEGDNHIWLVARFLDTVADGEALS